MAPHAGRGVRHGVPAPWAPWARKAVGPALPTCWLRERAVEAPSSCLSTSAPAPAQGPGPCCAHESRRDPGPPGQVRLRLQQPSLFNGQYQACCSLNCDAPQGLGEPQGPCCRGPGPGRVEQACSPHLTYNKALCSSAGDGCNDRLFFVGQVGIPPQLGKLDK